MYKRIMVAVDGSETSDRALHEAIGLACETGATLMLLHVCEEPPMMWEADGMSVAPQMDLMKTVASAGKALLERDLKQASSRKVAAETKLVESIGGRLGAIIAEEARTWQADLLVVGTHGRRGIDHILMGSVAEGVARTASMPVLLVRTTK